MIYFKMGNDRNSIKTPNGNPEKASIAFIFLGLVSYLNQHFGVDFDGCHVGPRQAKLLWEQCPCLVSRVKPVDGVKVVVVLVPAANEQK